jgi:hypothetical protein
MQVPNLGEAIGANPMAQMATDFALKGASD